MDPVLVSGLAAIGKNIFSNVSSADKTSEASSSDFDSLLKGEESDTALTSSSLDDIRAKLRETLMELSNNPDFMSLVGGLASGESANIQKNSEGGYDFTMQNGKEFSIASGSALHEVVDRLAQMKTQETSLRNDLFGSSGVSEPSTGFFVSLV